jgi:hypothetical protein
VVVEDWPGESPEFPGQAACNFHCVQQHRDEARWVAFIDVDEFLFSPTGRPVPEMLKEFEYAAALWVTRLGFGSSGHETKPDGPVIESYVRRSDDPVVNGKRLVDPKRVVQAGNVASEHAYTGPRVNTNHDPVERPRFPRLLDKLRINHYYTKSAEEARAKGQRIRPNDGKPQIALQRRLDAVLAGLDIATDTTIHMYLPQLREALERRKQGTVTS